MAKYGTDRNKTAKIYAKNYKNQFCTWQMILQLIPQMQNWRNP